MDWARILAFVMGLVGPGAAGAERIYGCARGRSGRAWQTTLPKFSAGLFCATNEKRAAALGRISAAQVSGRNAETVAECASAHSLDVAVLFSILARSTPDTSALRRP